MREQQIILKEHTYAAALYVYSVEGAAVQCHLAVSTKRALQCSADKIKQC
jgi:hypothetical protein